MWPKEEERITRDELVRRLEAASMPDNYLDKLVGQAIGLVVSWRRDAEGHYRCGHAGAGSKTLLDMLPLFTGSVDAAMRVPPEGSAVGLIDNPDDRDGRFRATIMAPLAACAPGGMSDVTVYHATSLPIALCIAALKCREPEAPGS